MTHRQHDHVTQFKNAVMDICCNCGSLNIVLGSCRDCGKTETATVYCNDAYKIERMVKEAIEAAPELGPQEPPHDYRIFNQRRADGTYPSLSDFFDKAIEKDDDFEHSTLDPDVSDYMDAHGIGVRP